MPSLPVVSGEEAVRALERLGFKQISQRGSHIVLRRGEIGRVVPNHNELAAGTLRGILKQASVSPDEIINALKKL
jgi:predicted RNA binding protein YcfA (HicA-like mRNA interferase family)